MGQGHSLDLVNMIATGHFTKAFDPNRLIPESTIDTLLQFLHSSPSSVNVQPWHFVVASSIQGKERINKGIHDDFALNEARILNASHVIVFCTRTTLSDQYLDEILEKEESDGRFPSMEAKAQWKKIVRGWIQLHQYDVKDLQHWMEKQVYLALGMFLLAASAVGVDVTPLEGFDPRKLDAELGLRERGFTSTVLVALGYRDQNDYNVGKPKSRLPHENLFTFL
jgi:nitroreductase / dihydropteridine reductase